MRWKPEDTPGQNARRVLPQLTRAWFEQGAGVTRPGVGSDALHAFRLETKHLRYTLELFEPVYGPGLQRRLAALREVQRSLGELNDLAVAGAHVLRVLPKGELKQVASRELQDRDRKGTARFRLLWRRLFGAPGEVDRWVRYLSRPRAAQV